MSNRDGRIRRIVGPLVGACLLAALAVPAASTARAQQQAVPVAPRAASMVLPAMVAVTAAGQPIVERLSALSADVSWKIYHRSLLPDAPRLSLAFLADDPATLYDASSAVLANSYHHVAKGVTRPRAILSYGDPLLSAEPAGRVLYLAANGAVSRSTDGGVSWRPRGTVPGAAPVTALAVTPVRPAILYAAVAGTGVIKSWDGGRTWTVLPTALFKQNDVIVTSLLVSALSPHTLWLGTSRGGLLRSTDGGQSWQHITVFPANRVVLSLAAVPGTDAVLYAGTDRGVYQSVDGGAHWILFQTDFATRVVPSVAVSPVQPARVYIAALRDIDWTTAGWSWIDSIWTTWDGGVSWNAGSVNVNTSGTHQPQLVADTHDPSTAYVALDSGVGRTTNAGASWDDWSGGQLVPGTTVSSIVPTLVSRSPADPADQLCWKTPFRLRTRNAPATTCARYFPNQHHNLTGAFLDFWNAYGGEPVFGDPRTEAFVLNGTLVQYTDRFRLDWHNGYVSTAPLGTFVTRAHPYPTVAPARVTRDQLYFGSTGHTLGGPFLRFWRTHHGALLLGAPISEPVHETNDDGSGRVYIVQWFSHGRLDYHPELTGSTYVVEVGLVGKLDLQRHGWLPRA